MKIQMSEIDFVDETPDPTHEPTLTTISIDISVVLLEKFSHWNFLNQITELLMEPGLHEKNKKVFFLFTKLFFYFIVFPTISIDISVVWIDRTIIIVRSF